jgi:hypothetical protein
MLMPVLIQAHATVSYQQAEAALVFGRPHTLYAEVRWRLQLARFSLVRAAERIAAVKRQQADPDNDMGAEERASEEGVRAVSASRHLCATEAAVHGC